MNEVATHFGSKEIIQKSKPTYKGLQSFLAYFLLSHLDLL